MMRLDVLCLILISTETEEEGALLPSNILFLAEDLKGGCFLGCFVLVFFSCGRHC